MSNPPSKPKKRPTEPPAFTVDTDSSSIQEMPTITSLLNRKKANITKDYPRKPEAPEVVEISPLAPTSSVQPVISRRSKRPPTPLKIWKDADLTQSSGFVEKGLQYLTQNAAIRAIFFKPMPGNEKRSRIKFHAVQAYQPGELEGLWMGLQFTGSLVPDLWNQLVRHGVIEVAASQQPVQDASSSRQALRTFLGLAANDSFVLIRCGSAEHCTGILAVVSKTAVGGFLENAFPELFASKSKSAA